MNDDPSAMHVLYIQVEEDAGIALIEDICSSIMDRLSVSSLLLPQDERKTKLHVTLLNTRFRKHETKSTETGAVRPVMGRRSNRTEHLPFDGRSILESFKCLDLGSVKVRTVHLSQRGVFDSSGYYHCAHEVGRRGAR